MRREGDVTRMEEIRNAYILVVETEGKKHLEDLGLDVRIILE